jgi:phosphotransferase system enzyme I (PtsI)
MAERRLHGEPAAPGLAIGPLLRLEEAPAASVALAAGNPEAEQLALGRAMAKAGEELAALASVGDAMAAEMLEFQIELLADPSLVEEALAAIAAGASAARAWRAALDAQIAAYSEGDDDYFRARAADLADLRERVLSHLAGNGVATTILPPGAIVLARDLGPSRFLGLDWTELGGAAFEEGSRTSHVAMLARARGVPLVTGLGHIGSEDVEAILDGAEGALIVSPGEVTRTIYELRRIAAAAENEAELTVLNAPAVLRSGEQVAVMINVDDPAAASPGAFARCDGVGLTRTEFLFIGRDRLPDEDSQTRTYVELLELAAGKPVIVRTLDVGGDKPLPGITLPTESNPFLGLRGIRLCLERPGLFRPQMRALLRAAMAGPLKVMLPMISHPDEIEEARHLFARELADLAGTPARMPELGIMIEVPAVAVTIERFAAAAFFSIGSNDLVQYALAASRDAGGRVARLADPCDPAVLRLIGNVVAYGRETGKEVSVCGDMASDPAGLAALLDLGVRRISVAPAALGRVKAAIAHG